MKIKTRHSKQCNAVSRLLKSTTAHPTADNIYTALRGDMPGISLATVYRNLAKLVSAGEIQSFRLEGVEHFDARCDKHYHLLCTGCGSVTDIEADCVPELDEPVRKTSGMEIDDHFLVFYGKCPICRKQHS